MSSNRVITGPRTLETNAVDTLERGVSNITETVAGAVAAISRLQHLIDSGDATSIQLRDKILDSLSTIKSIANTAIENLNPVIGETLGREFNWAQAIQDGVSSDMAPFDVTVTDG